MPDLLRRRWWPIAVGVCIGVLAALVTEKLNTPQVFEARSAVAIDPDKMPRGVLRWDGELDVFKLRDALLSDATLHQVIARAFPGVSSPEVERYLARGILVRLDLTYSPRTGIIGFSYHDHDRVRAAEVVNLFARFLGENNIVNAATPPAVPVVPNRSDYLVVGVAGGLLGGLLGGLFKLFGWLLGRVAVREVRA